MRENSNSNINKNVLLIGGTGAIGIYVAKECIKLGYIVYVTTRNYSLKDSDSLRYLHGNAKEPSFLHELKDKRDYCAVIDFMVYSTSEFSEAIKQLLELSPQYIFVSSFRVFSDSNHSLINEESEKLIDQKLEKNFACSDDYALAKARQEKLLESQYSNSGWTIVRPSITYSTGRFQFGALEANTIIPRSEDRLPVPIPVEILTKKTTMTWAGDVGKMISLLICNKKALNESYNVLTHESNTWERVAEIYSSLINMKYTVVSLDDYLNLGLSKWQIKYDRLFNRICCNDKILSVTGMKKSDLMPLEEGLKLEVREFYKKEHSHSTVNKINGRLDRVSNILRFPGSSSARFFISYYLGRFL